MSKIVLKVEELKKALGKIGSVIDSKPAQPAYAGVRISTYETGTLPPYSVRVTGMNIGASFTVTLLSANPSGPMDILVPFGRLSEVAGLLKTPEAAITLNDEGTVATISAGKYKGPIKVLNVAEFPAAMSRPENSTAVLDLPSFIGQIGKVEFAIPPNDGKYTVSVAKVEATQSADGDKDTSSLKLIATDGFRLALSAAAKNVGTFELVLPKSAFDLIKKLDGGKSLAIYKTESGFIFDTFEGDKVIETLTVNQTSGAFPPYQSILPQTHKVAFGVDPNALLYSASLLKALTADEEPVIIFHLAEGSATAQLSTREDGAALGEDEIDLTAPVTGGTIDFALKYKLLADFLGSATGTLTVQATDNKNLVDFYAEGNAYRFLQMPQPA